MMHDIKKHCNEHKINKIYNKYKKNNFNVVIDIAILEPPLGGEDTLRIGSKCGKSDSYVFIDREILIDFPSNKIHCCVQDNIQICAVRAIRKEFERMYNERDME